ncbi:hypothetical protein RSAG8_13335, partial [Rhizoctonia solani AG-8 WAC10335]
MDVTDLLDLNSFSESPDEDYTVSHVYRGKLHDGTTVEIQTKGEDHEGEDWSKDMQNMLDIWTKCSHPNITQLIGKATFRENLAAVYHRHEYSSIKEYPDKHPGEFSDRSRLSAQICDGVAYLHSNGIIHGDLDGHCIMISGDGVPHIWLSVFTTSTVSNAVEYNPMWGTMYDVSLFQCSHRSTRFDAALQAPELYKRGAKHTFASDVFALGMTIWASIPLFYVFDRLGELRPPHSQETFTRDLWYSSDPDIDPLGNQLQQGELPSRPTVGIPADTAGNMLWDILCKCWSFKPEDRPTASEVSAVMHMVCKTLGSVVFCLLGINAPDHSGVVDGVALIPPRLVVREDTSVQDLVSHFEQRGLANYTETIYSGSMVTIVSVADTALANVYRVELPDYRPIAVKCVKHNTPYKRLKRAARELDCWSSYKHENILPVFGFAMVGADLAMVSPWMSNGCITDYVAKYLTCDRLILCVQLAKAIAYLHENNVVHGDIKGPNVLVSDTGAIQITDFGVSIMDHQEIEFSATSSGRGTQRWQAPEILTGKTDSTREADVYALGMTMVEIYTGEQPYGSTNWYQIMIPVINGQLRPPRPMRLPIDDIGNGVWELMQHCWETNPSERAASDRVYEWLEYYASIRTDTPRSG